MNSKKEIIHNHLETGEKTVSWEELSEEQKKNRARQIFAALAILWDTEKKNKGLIDSNFSYRYNKKYQIEEKTNEKQRII